MDGQYTLTVATAPPETIWWLQWHLRRAREEMYARKDDYLLARHEYQDVAEYVKALKIILSREE